MKNIKFSFKEIIFISISLVIILIYLIGSFQHTKQLNRNKNYEHLICLNEICIDNGIYNRCITFANSQAFAIKILENNINNGKILKLIKLNKTCK